MIESPSRTQDAYGADIPTWTTWKAVWASIEPLTGRQFLLAAQATLETTHEIRIRWQPEVTAKMRIVFEGRTFGIETIMNVEERDRELVLMCKELT